MYTRVTDARIRSLFQNTSFGPSYAIVRKLAKIRLYASCSFNPLSLINGF